MENNIVIVFFLCLTTCAASTFSTEVFTGDNCTVPETNAEGKCIDINTCDYAKKLLQSHKPPPVCGFTRNYPLVCCPIEIKTKIPGEKSTKACNRYFDATKRTPPVAFGEKALAKEFPHMAAIGFVNKAADILWLCGGSLISATFVLTAAHCVKSKDFGAAKWVRLGDLDLTNTTEGANPIDVLISKAYAHPDYRPPSHYHDIALLKLEKEISFGIQFKPACLHTSRDISVSTLQATGWGKLGFLEQKSSHLMKVDLKIVDYETCATKYSTVSRRRLAQGLRDEYQICAGDPSGKDTCPGDSGGPLHFKDDGSYEVLDHFVIVGITSFGKGCGNENSAGVYTRVSSYVGWIESIIWDQDEYA